MIRSAFVSVMVTALFPLFASGGEAEKPAQVKVAAVQMLGYDKTDMPRPGFDPSEAVVRYIEKAAKDGAQLVVFPEYLLGQDLGPRSPDGADLQSSGGGKDLRRRRLLGGLQGRDVRQHGPPVRPGGQDRRQIQQGPRRRRPVRGRAALVEAAEGQGRRVVHEERPRVEDEEGRRIPRLRPGFRPDRHPHLLRRLVPGDLPHPVPQGGRDCWCGSTAAEGRWRTSSSSRRCSRTKWRWSPRTKPTVPGR